MNKLKFNTYSSGHPGQTGFQSAGHTPTSCPGCGEHLLHHAHPQICWVVKGLVFSHFWKGHTNSNECFFFPFQGGKMNIRSKLFHLE